METAVLAIQRWWKNMPRCRKCDRLYEGDWMCDPCYADKSDAPYPRYVSIGIRGRERDFLIVSL